MLLRKLILFVALIVILPNQINSQKSDPPFLQFMYHPWVDSVMNTLTPERQIAQCIWVAGWSDRDTIHRNEVTGLIGRYGIGGIVFFQGTPEKQADLINYYQKKSIVPLLISMDAEWGPGMRLDKVVKFPYQMTLGAIKNDSLILRFGESVAYQLKRTGVHINLAPVADINNNPLNPVINYRSFGENRENVAAKSVLYMQGLQGNGIMATAKHFPGHGDTDIDSHSDLPVIKHSSQRLDSLELYPFKKLIKEGISCIMTAHLNLPSLDSSVHLPSTLSKVIIKKLLIDSLGFKGLIITDAMNMQGVTRYFRTGEAEAKALEAGNDVVEFVTNVEAAISETKKLIDLKKITAEDIALKCRKVLAMKYYAGLPVLQEINKENIISDLNSSKTRALIRELYASSLTLLKNEQNIIPIKNIQNTRIATVAINRSSLTQFQDRIADYGPADHYFINPGNQGSVDTLLKKLAGYDLVIAGVFGLDQRPRMQFGITTGLTGFIEKLGAGNKAIVIWFGNPYAAGRISSLANAAGLLLAYQENDFTEDLSAQLIFGGIGANGSLPVAINEKWPFGFGLITPGNIRMQYGLPENAGVSAKLLENGIDSIVGFALEKKVFPGCLVMAACRGIVIFSKTYGYTTYDSLNVFDERSLFDLASVTKVAAATPALMLLEASGKFSTEETLGTYVPYFRRSDKGEMLMADILTHQAGFKSWIAYWEKTVKKSGDFKRGIYNKLQSEKYPLEVAEGLYITSKYKLKIYREIKQSPVSGKKYLYSDLGFIIAPEIIETLSGEKFSDYITSNIYQRIGAYDICFNPLSRYPADRIIPTEYDSLFRKQLLLGTVHDEGAAMFGGISGHAGLFATGNDLMKLLEMYRRMGSYGGEQIIPEDIMKKYTAVQFPENDNRRGLGFDKPLLDNSELSGKEAYPARSASPSSFGHSGYTGTFVWVDPEYELSFIFLSNRVYPTRKNNLITELNVRSDVLQAIYDSIIKQVATGAVQ
jgi:beta-N-acetylhexosaminidase